MRLGNSMYYRAYFIIHLALILSLFPIYYHTLFPIYYHTSDIGDWYMVGGEAQQNIQRGRGLKLSLGLFGSKIHNFAQISPKLQV